jgi:hypothetical protein
MFHQTPTSKSVPPITITRAISKIKKEFSESKRRVHKIIQVSSKTQDSEAITRGSEISPLHARIIADRACAGR